MDIAEIYRDHWTFIVRYLKRRCDHNQHEAEDLAQETFETAMRKLSSFTDGHVRTWLCGIAIWKMRSSQKSWARRAHIAERDGLFDELEPVTPDISVTVEARQLLDRCRAAVAGMPGPDIECFELVLVEGLSHAAVAEIQGCQVGTIAARMLRIRHKLDMLMDSAPIEQAPDTANITPEGIQVLPGQVWRVISRKDAYLTISRVANGFAYVQNGARERGTDIKRMYRHRHGYVLVEK